MLDSPLNNAFAHFLMLSLFFAGEHLETLGKWLHCQAELYRAQPIETFDTAAVRLSFPGGLESLWACTHSARGRIEPSLHFAGDAGEAVWRFDEGAVILPKGGAVQTLSSLPLLRHRSRMLEVVLRVLSGEDAFVCTTAVARAHTRLIVALHRQVPVLPVPEQHLERFGDGGDAQIAILGVEGLLGSCLASGKLPSETGSNWPRLATHFSPAEREEPAAC